MRSSSVLIGLVVVASLALDLALGAAAFAQPVQQGHAPILTRLALVAMLVSQVALVASWSTLSQSRLAGRLLGVIVITVISGQILGRLLDPAGHRLVSVWTSLVMLEAAVVAVAMIVARPWGLHVCHPGRLGSTAPSTNPLQYSLASLLAWTTAVAVALGLCRYSFLSAAQALPTMDFWLRALLASVAVSALSLSVLWAVLGDGSRLASSFLVSVVLPLSAMALWSTGQFRAWPVVIVLCLLQAASVGFTLAGIRVAGYRLARSNAQPVAR